MKKTKITFGEIDRDEETGEAQYVPVFIEGKRAGELFHYKKVPTLDDGLQPLWLYYNQNRPEACWDSEDADLEVMKIKITEELQEFVPMLEVR